METKKQDEIKQNQRKVECISQISTFLLFRLFLYKCSVLSFFFPRLTRHFKCLSLIFFLIIHNGRLAVIVLFINRQILIRHIPQCNFPPLKEMFSTFLKKKKKEKMSSMHSYKNDKSTKKQPNNLYLIASDTEQKVNTQYSVFSHVRLQGNTNTDKVTAILGGSTHSEFKSFGENNMDDSLRNKTHHFTAFTVMSGEVRVLRTTVGR